MRTNEERLLDIKYTENEIKLLERNLKQYEHHVKYYEKRVSEIVYAIGVHKAELDEMLQIKMTNL